MTESTHFSEIFDPDTKEWAVFRVLSNGSMEPWTLIKPSTVAKGGMGAFAARNFKVGTTVGWYTGCLCSENDALLDGEYAMGAGHRRVVDAASGGSWTRFMNDGRRKRRNDVCNVVTMHDLHMETTKYIKKGQEMFIDYGVDYWTARRI
jgi:hypothetical protein